MRSWLTDHRRIADQRLRHQLITRPGSRRVDRVVAWLGAVQAQEYGPAKWGLALRSSPGTRDTDVERAVAQGRILRTHVLRPTWHFVARDDLRWMLELTGPEVHRRIAPYHQQLGLHAPVMTRATGVIERVLGDGGCLTRAELGIELARVGQPAGRMALAQIMMYAELEGVICSGPRRGKQFTYSLLAHRAPPGRSFQRDEALAELSRRYFRSHGPATVRDFVWWSGLRTSDAVRGLEMIRARSREVDGLRYWSVGRSAPAGPAKKAAVHLLPIYDEYLVAYRDRRAVPRPAYDRGGLQHALVIAGRVVGTWRVIPGATSVAIELAAERRLTAGEQRGLAQVTARYGRFLGVPARLHRSARI